MTGRTWLHGVKAGRMVHVGGVEAPVSIGDVRHIAAEFKKAMGTGKDAPTTNAIDVLAWDFAFELNEVARQQAADAKIHLTFKRIPRDVMDKRAVEQGDIKFFELAALSVDLKAKEKTVTLKLTDFIIPPDDVPEEVRQAVKYWSQWIDYWAVDWDNKNDTFHNQWQTFRTRKENKLALETTHTYAEPGEYRIVVKVIDILGNDTTKTVKAKVKGRELPMPRKKTSSAAPTLFDVRTTTAPCVPTVRDRVAAWRDGGYTGATETTLRLLHYWFHTDHRLTSGRRFAYHWSQRYAVETLIWLYEIAKVRRQKELIESFAGRQDLKLLQYDDFSRYCIKMATGSGKTKVMALAIAWLYFNAVAEGRDDYAQSFLVIAPTVIVFERLRTDFGGGRIFHLDPVIPDDLRIYWDFQCYMRGEAERASSLGALYLTNVQQLYDQSEGQTDEPEVMTATLGPKPPAQGREVEDFIPRLKARGGPVAVLNDEAHHTHDEGSEWNQCIRRVHAEVPGGLAGQLDFPAPPRHTKGQLFSWTVFDYPLKQAILDGIVKRPLKGIAKGITEQRSAIASVRYQAYLAAGVERWKEYRDQLAPLGRKPVLFVMMNDTTEADDVGDWLQRKYPAEFGSEHLLVIHTDKSGEVSKKDLDKARQVARNVDEHKSPVHCIVSVVMLREGWEVQGVTVIVGLRPYTAKANILPEQTVGRGLRLMFRDQGTGYVERVDSKIVLDFEPRARPRNRSPLRGGTIYLRPDAGSPQAVISLPVGADGGLRAVDDVRNVRVR